MQIKKLISLMAVVGTGYLFVRAGQEFWLLVREISSLKWQAAFYASSAAMVVFVLLAAVVLFWPERLQAKLSGVLDLRSRLGVWRWALLFVPGAAAVYVLQYSKYGEIFSGPALRLSLGLVLLVYGGFVLSKREEIVSFSALLQSGVVVSAIFAAGFDFIGVRRYPFSLGWSEGNRLWDYSALFGRRLYDFPQDQTIFAYTDFGRQLVGGLPFLFDGVSIWMARFWWALTNTLLYALFGWVLFRQVGERGKRLVLLGLWTYLFLNQGPIHPPLVVCAILVSLAWRRTYWAAVPLLIAAGYFAQLSRFTWMFAPAMWILVLEFSEPGVARKPGKTWLRAAVLTLAGLAGGVLIPTMQGWLAGGAAESSTGMIGFALTQGLLWYRLLPNATYGQGVLVGLAQAVIPLFIVLGYLLASRRWKLQMWQKLVVWGVLLAFSAVGLIVSTKIGGGGDLHNLDMLLIGMVLAAAAAWQNGGRSVIIEGKGQQVLIQVVLLALVILPGLRSLQGMMPLSSLASREEADMSLELIREQVEAVPEDGRVLFMDQRQLLTFGYIEAGLIDEYEKKYLMDQALGGNAAFFADYYQDLAEGYFDLIVTEPLHTQQRGSDYVFGEENDAWVAWVSAPTLCFYEELPVSQDLRESVGVVLLVPKADISPCVRYLELESGN